MVLPLVTQKVVEELVELAKEPKELVEAPEELVEKHEGLIVQLIVPSFHLLLQVAA